MCRPSLTDGLWLQVFTKRLLRMERLAERFKAERVDGRRLMALTDEELREKFGVEDVEARRRLLEERDRVAVEEPSAAEATAAVGDAGGGDGGAAAEYERRLAAWKGRLRSLWRMTDGGSS